MLDQSLLDAGAAVFAAVYVVGIIADIVRDNRVAEARLIARTATDRADWAEHQSACLRVDLERAQKAMLDMRRHIIAKQFDSDDPLPDTETTP